jgi:hypothetical protein
MSEQTVMTTDRHVECKENHDREMKWLREGLSDVNDKLDVIRDKMSKWSGIMIAAQILAGAIGSGSVLALAKWLVPVVSNTPK